MGRGERRDLFPRNETDAMRCIACFEAEVAVRAPLPAGTEPTAVCRRCDPQSSNLSSSFSSSLEDEEERSPSRSLRCNRSEKGKSER